MALIDVYNLRHDGEFQARVEVAIAKVAIDVYTEDVATPNHAARVEWAKDALLNSTDMTSRMMWAVVGNSTIYTAGTASSDAQILTVVAGLVDPFTQVL